MKLKINPSIVQSSPQEAFKLFSEKVTNRVKNGQLITYKEFSYQLFEIGDAFEKRSNKETMNRISQRFAEALVGLKENNLAGIVYSYLIKFNPNNAKLREHLATNALAIAKRLQDPVHIAARATELKDLCDTSSPQYLKFLYETKRALVSIVDHYENAQKKFKTINRKIKPKEVYTEALFNIKYLIAKCIKNNQPQQALEELRGAKSLIQGEHIMLFRIEKLMRTIERKLLEHNVSKNRSN